MQCQSQNTTLSVFLSPQFSFQFISFQFLVFGVVLKTGRKKNGKTHTHHTAAATQQANEHPTAIQEAVQITPMIHGSISRVLVNCIKYNIQHELTNQLLLF